MPLSFYKINLLLTYMFTTCSTLRSRARTATSHWTPPSTSLTSVTRPRRQSTSCCRSSARPSAINCWRHAALTCGWSCSSCKDEFVCGVTECDRAWWCWQWTVSVSCVWTQTGGGIVTVHACPGKHLLDGQRDLRETKELYCTVHSTGRVQVVTCSRVPW